MTALPFFVLTLASAGAAPQGVLIDFMSQSCPPCREMSPVVSRLHQQGYPVRKVDVDENPELAQKFNITRIPAFVLVINGREVNRIIGLTTEGQLKRLLAQIPTEPAEAIAKTDDTSTSPKPAAGGKQAKPKGIPVVTVDDGNKRKGFEFPFLGKKSKQEGVVVLESGASKGAVVRANNENPTSQPAQAANGPVASSVRIRVKDASGTNFGSGTIIASKPGRAYVLACGHIFRDVDKAITVEIDVFTGKKLETFPGTVVRYDLTAEVGVVSISPEKILPVAKIATLEHPPVQGDRVFSVGCGGGEPPAIEKLEIKGLNLYRGPDTIECTGVPSQGRSGGALFNSAGRIIGVCFAADPERDRGIYAGLKPIHKLLDEADLSSLYRDEPTPPATSNSQLAAAEGENDRGGSGIREASVREENDVDTAAAERVADANRAAEIQAASENAEDAEVVCIIRPLNNPQEASRVVIINRASSRFVHYLQGELRNQPHPTMARQPAKNADDSTQNSSSPAVETRTARRPSVGPDLREESAGLRPYRRSASSR
ncbi:MAG: trypsin-like peptidase domain-containing protein [Pirellulales bacterium]